MPVKSHYNNNNLVSVSTLNFTFPAPHADDLALKMLQSHCGSTGKSFDGHQHTILLFALFSHIDNKINSGAFRINNKIYKSLCKVNDKEFTMVFEFRTTKALIKRVLGSVFKECKPKKLKTRYINLCKLLGFKNHGQNVAEFNYCCDELAKHLKSMVVYGSGKVSLSNKEFDELVKSQVDKLDPVAPPKDNKKLNARQAPGKPTGEDNISSVSLSDYHLDVKSAYAPYVRDFISAKTNAHWVGSSLYWCQPTKKSLSLEKVFTEKNVDKFIKNFDRFDKEIKKLNPKWKKDAKEGENEGVKKFIGTGKHTGWKEAIVHDLLSSGVSANAVSGTGAKAISKANFKKALLACSK